MRGDYVRPVGGARRPAAGRGGPRVRADCAAPCPRAGHRGGVQLLEGVLQPGHRGRRCRRRIRPRLAWWGSSGRRRWASSSTATASTSPRPGSCASSADQPGRGAEPGPVRPAGDADAPAAGDVQRRQGLARAGLRRSATMPPRRPTSSCTTRPERQRGLAGVAGGAAAGHRGAPRRCCPSCCG